MTTKLLIIGIDGATWDIITPLMNNGNLPNFKRLIEEGVTAPLESMHPLVTPIIWTTIATGKIPQKHGITHLLDTQKKLRCNRIWDILEERKNKIGVFGWPLIDPPRKVNGFLIPGFFARSDKAYPPSYDFITKLRLEHGKRDVIHSLIKGFAHGITFATAKNLLIFYLKRKNYTYLERYYRTKWLRTIITKDVFKHLYSKIMPEFSAFYMNHTDQIGHRMWMYYEPEKFNYTNPEGIKKYGEIIPKTYILADEIIGELLEILSPDTHIIILSDHGMKASSNEEGFRIREALFSFLELEKREYSLVDNTMMIKLDKIDESQIEQMKKKIESVRYESNNEKVFSVVRERNNLLVSFILKVDLKDIDKEKIFLENGKKEWLRTIVSPVFMEYSGTHALHGILIMYGPKFKKGIRLDKASVLDITPTILHLYDMPSARDMDGEILVEAFKEEFNSPLDKIETYETGRLLHRREEKNTEELSDDLRKRLQSLGYLD